MSILCDTAAERAILSAIFKFGADAYFDVCDILNSNTFTVDSNKWIYECLIRIFEDDSNPKIDVSLIFSTAKDLGTLKFLERQTEVEHLKALMIFPASLENLRKFAQKIRKLQIIRDERVVLEQTKDALLNLNGTESVAEILSVAENAIFDFGCSLDQTGNQPELIGAGLREKIQHRIENPVDQLGLSTGFPMYDKIIGGGLLEGTVNVIIARQKVGKSMFVNQIGFNLAIKQIPVLNLDSEMTKNDQQYRTLASISKIIINEIKTGRFAKDSNKLARVNRAIEQIESKEKYPYYHKSTAGCSFEEQLSILRRWIMMNVGLREDGSAKDCLVIYDYLKLMDSKEISGNMQEYQALGFMMTQLHNMAVKYKIPILACGQANKDGLNKEDSSIVAGSDRITNLCSSMCLFKPKTLDEMNEDGFQSGNRKMIPLASRHDDGLNFGEYINFGFEKKYGRIRELGTNMQPIEDSQPILDEGVNFNSE